MSKINIFLHGQEIAILQLEEGREYIIGRGSDCSVQLPAEKGISRQHLKIAFNGAIWSASLISKTGSLLFDGKPSQKVDLGKACRFIIPPFEFEYTPFQQPTAHDASAADRPAEIVDAVDTSNLARTEMVPQPNFDATQPGLVALVPYLTLYNGKTGDELIYKLEGHVWTAGRHPSSEIFIDDSAVSRKHFEISRSDTGYFIKELGSSNGVLLNGVPVESNRSYPLSSGDKFSVRHIEMKFEIHDEKHEEKVKGIKALPAVIEQPDNDVDNEDVESSMPMVNNIPAPAVMRMDPRIYEQSEAKKPSKKMLLAAVAVILVLVAVFSNDDKEDLPSNSEDGAKAEAGADGVVKGPSAEQLAEAKHLFDLAKNYYRTRNYEFCLNQLEKLHAVVPSFENSKELETYCSQAIELERINDDRERKERERDEVARKIRQVLENCKQKQNYNSSQMRECLMPVLELSPDDPEAMSLISDRENREEANRINAQNAASAQAFKNKGRNAFEKAKAVEKSGQVKSAIAAYKDFLKMDYGLPGEQSEARQAISRLEGELVGKANEHVKSCSSFVSSNQYRNAVLECQKALEIDPGNGQAKSLQASARQKQRVELKKIYEQAILEEGFGNVEAAKAKFNEIIQASGRGEEYYEKAKSKLKKYGGFE